MSIISISGNYVFRDLSNVFSSLLNVDCFTLEISTTDKYHGKDALKF